MQPKLDADATTVEKALRLYMKLLLDGRRHYQSDLAKYLNCSPQTVIRLVAEIEAVIGACLVRGMDRHRRWYQIKSVSRNRLGLDFEELRYLSICRDLAEPYLPEEVRERVDHSIFNFSLLLADQDYAERERAQKKQIGYCAKGWINYTPYFGILEQLVQAMENKAICLVLYRSPASQVDHEHRFAPNRIIAMNNALYVLGASVTDDFTQMRFLTNLAVHRIKQVTLTDKICPFQIPEADLGMFGLPRHEPKKFRIFFKAGPAAQYVRERIWSEQQTIRESENGDIVLEIVSRSEPEVVAWARSFGDDARLLPSAGDE